MSADQFDPARYLAQLQPPNRVPGRSQPDRGFCFDEDGAEHQLVSGYGDQLSAALLQQLRQLGHVDERHMPEIAAHVEAKGAACMQGHASTRGSLVFNGPPCVGPLSCDTVLSAVRPEWTHRPVVPAGPAVMAYWRHEHGETPFQAQTPADANSMIDQLLAEDFGHSVAALYVASRPLNRVGLPDHELRIGVDAAADTGGLRYMGGRGTWFSAGSVSRHEHVCYHHMGWAAPFPRDSELPIHRIRAAVHEFMTAGGRRPSCVTWQPVPALT